MTQYILRGTRAVSYIGVGKNRLSVLRRGKADFAKALVVMPRGTVRVDKLGPGSRITIETKEPYAATYLRTQALGDRYVVVVGGATGEPYLNDYIFAPPKAPDYLPTHVVGSPIFAHAKHNVFSINYGQAVVIGAGLSHALTYISRFDFSTFQRLDLVIYDAALGTRNESLACMEPVGENPLGIAYIAVSMPTYLGIPATPDRFYPSIFVLAHNAAQHEKTNIWPPASISNARPPQIISNAGRGRIAFFQTYYDTTKPELVIYDVFNGTYTKRSLDTILPGFGGADQNIATNSDIVCSGQNALTGAYYLTALVLKGDLISVASLYTSSDSGLTWAAAPNVATGPYAYSGAANDHTLTSMKDGCIAYNFGDYYGATVPKFFSAFSADHGKTWVAIADTNLNKSPLHVRFRNSLLVVPRSKTSSEYSAMRVLADGNTVMLETYSDYGPNATLVREEVITKTANYFRQAPSILEYTPSLCKYTPTLETAAADPTYAPLKPGHPNLLERLSIP